MLRITSQSNAAGACHYFDPKSHDYYLDGQELAGQWGGKGAKLLGLSGDVRPDDFKALAYNRNPETGRKLTARDHANRRVGHDLTFSVPKSVTLAFELLKDDRILNAFRESVFETMADIERDALTRDRRGGKEDLVQPDNLTHATFIHRSSRPVKGIPDCQLHAHVFVFNATKHDGRWTAVELGKVKAEAPYYEALAMARLGKKLVDLGYGVRRKGKFFELEGVSNELVDKFSRRTKLIEAVAVERNVTDPDYKAELGGKTREHKLDGPHSSPADLRKEWIARLTDAEKRQLKNLPGQVTPLPSVEQSARFALDHSFERSAVMPVKRVLEEGLRHGVGRITLDELTAGLPKLGLLTKGEESTTREMLALEAGMVQFARDGRGSAKPIPRARSSPQSVPVSSKDVANSPHSARAVKPTENLTPGQQAAIRHILTSRDRVTLVRGAAGTGKTTALETAASSIRHAGYVVQAVAISTTAADELKQVDPGSATLARFLLDTKMQDAVAGGVVIADEASLIGTKQAAAFFRVLERIDARAVFVGDVKQHGAVTSGSPFQLLQQHASLPVAEITEVMRQRGAYKRVSEYLSEHRTDAALDLLEQLGHVHEADYTERMKLIADDYWDAVKRKQSVLVVAPTHEEGNAVTGVIRERLKAEGKLKDDEREFTRLVPLNLTEAERGDGHRLEAGDVLQFHRASGKHKAGDRVHVGEGGTARAGSHDLWPAAHGSAYRVSSLKVAPGDAVRITANGKDKSGKHKLKNGAVYTVKGFDRKGDIQLDNGWVVDKSFGHISHGYVSTSHASQGRTVDVVLVSESSKSFPAASAEQFYVSISRGKRAAYVYSDDVQALREAVSLARPKVNATDVFHHVVQPHGMVNRVKSRAMFMGRVRGIASKAVQVVREKVRQLTKQREMDYGIG